LTDTVSLAPTSESPRRAGQTASDRQSNLQRVGPVHQFVDTLPTGRAHRRAVCCAHQRAIENTVCCEALQRARLFPLCFQCSEIRHYPAGWKRGSFGGKFLFSLMLGYPRFGFGWSGIPVTSSQVFQGSTNRQDSRASCFHFVSTLRRVRPSDHSFPAVPSVWRGYRSSA
jgi:hypothetical protein